MHLKISGHHMNNGKALEKYVSSKIRQHIKKYFKHAVSADVTFLKEHNQFNTSIIINEGVRHSQHIQGHALADNAYKSFNLAMQRTATQLRRYKDRIKSERRA